MQVKRKKKKQEILTEYSCSKICIKCSCSAFFWASACSDTAALAFCKLLRTSERILCPAIEVMGRRGRTVSWLPASWWSGCARAFCTADSLSKCTIQYRPWEKNEKRKKTQIITRSITKRSQVSFPRNKAYYGFNRLITACMLSYLSLYTWSYFTHLLTFSLYAKGLRKKRQKKKRRYVPQLHSVNSHKMLGKINLILALLEDSPKKD